MKTLLLNVDGMSCGRCKAKIEDNFKEEQSINEVSVSLEEKTVKIKGSDSLSMMGLKGQIEELGFSVTGMKKVD